ncbi:MAG: hypothetical protein JNJ49_02920 [Bdellovibrionaceae bacterium]|nr:hypothetical protein [Pseudobdellovibrionaceae bacterium]
MAITSKDGSVADTNISDFFSKMTFPSWRDPRWVLAAYAITFILFAINTPGFARTPTQFFVGFATCVVVDCLFLFLVKGVSIFPLSGMLSSMGVFLLCDSPHVWPYFVVGLLTILSKHLLVIGGRHIFNPNNFGVVMGFLFLPSYMTITASRWGPNSAVVAVLSLFGLFLVYRAKRLPLVLSFLAVFSLGAWARSALTGVNLLTVFSPAFGAAFQLFIFYHITDPKTSPSKSSHQLYFGVVLAVIDAIFRYNQNKYAPFLSLFILTGFYSFLRSYYRLDSSANAVAVKV